jgi:hypothetical protein
VAGDPEVDRYIIRDCDSRLNPRERLAVEEWIGSGKRIHSIRDHPNHDRPLNGGLWGGVKGAVPDMEQLVKGFSGTRRDKYMGDLDFLNRAPRYHPPRALRPRRTASAAPVGHDRATHTRGRPRLKARPTNLPVVPVGVSRSGVASASSEELPDGPRRLLVQQVPQLPALSHSAPSRLPARGTGLLWRRQNPSRGYHRLDPQAPRSEAVPWRPVVDLRLTRIDLADTR